MEDSEREGVQRAVWVEGGVAAFVKGGADYEEAMWSSLWGGGAWRVVCVTKRGIGSLFC